MAEKYSVYLSPTAERQELQHLRFLGQVSKKAAVELRNRFVEAFLSLEEMPKRYPFLDEEGFPKNKYRKLFVANWFLVLYEVIEDRVVIDYILDCRQDYRWLLHE